jgi:hypothetical protein
MTLTRKVKHCKLFNTSKIQKVVYGTGVQAQVPGTGTDYRSSDSEFFYESGFRDSWNRNQNNYYWSRINSGTANHKGEKSTKQNKSCWTKWFKLYNFTVNTDNIFVFVSRQFSWFFQTIQYLSEDWVKTRGRIKIFWQKKGYCTSRSKQEPLLDSNISTLGYLRRIRRIFLHCHENVKIETGVSKKG